MQIKNILILSILLSVTCNAQQDTSVDSSQDINRNEVQFYIYNQVIVAYKYDLSGNSSIRFKANLTGFFNDRKSENIEYGNPETNTPDYHRVDKEVRSEHFFELSVHYLYLIKAHPYLKLFLGGGPFGNYDFRLSNGIVDYYSDKNIFQGSSQTSHNEYLLNLGVSVAAGFESAVYKNINIFAEYEAAFSRGWNKYKYSTSYSNYSSEQRYNEWIYELRGIRLGIGINF